MKTVEQVKRELIDWISDGCPSFKLGKSYSKFEFQRCNEDGENGYGVRVMYFDERSYPIRFPEKFFALKQLGLEQFELEQIEQIKLTELVDKYFDSIPS